MKKKTIICMVLGYFLIFSTNIFANPISVLFIGNSFTHMNNFYMMVAALAAEKNDTIITDYAAIDSYTLEKHFTDTNTINKICSKFWDYIVLQEQSQRPIMDSATFFNKTLFYTRKLVDTIQYHNPATTILLFQTWGRKYGDSELCPCFSWACSYDTMQDKLIERYNYLGSLLALEVIPFGRAWKYFSPTSPNHIDLFYEDNKHPNVAGSYLNACIFYSFLTQKSLVGINYNPAGLTNKELETIQRIAFDIVFKK